MPETPPKKVVDVLTAATQYLHGKGIESPGLAAKLLLSRLLNCKHLDLIVRYDVALSDKQLEAMRRGIKRVGAGEPVQYVIGETGFMGHAIKTDKRALIPRPETELLVETVLDCAALWQRPRPVVLDVGTGSGCIIASLAKARPDAQYLAFDVSEEALSLARENAAVLGVADRVTFTRAELGDAMEPETAHSLVSNLPYIPSAAIAGLQTQVRDHEPLVALDGGVSGVEVIEGVVCDAAIVLKPGGMLFLEIGADQGQSVSTILRDAGFDAVTVKKDLAGLDRIVTGVLPMA
ncbi:MAG: peptide chain release factor N(5)-glutamine methyltransferase [Verrucomicrobia bacterium]|nr:peptide chain release factor N(5)-glutamine methyltransferase [Verrucomicrobiota bacterium]